MYHDPTAVNPTPQRPTETFYEKHLITRIPLSRQTGGTDTAWSRSRSPTPTNNSSTHGVDDLTIGSISGNIAVAETIVNNAVAYVATNTVAATVADDDAVAHDVSPINQSIPDDNLWRVFLRRGRDPEKLKNKMVAIADP